MIDESRFDALVNGFYRAATGAIDWNQALTPVQATFGASAAVFQSIDLPTGRLLQLSNGGPPRQAVALDYVRQWHLADPRRRHVLAHPELVVDRWFHCHDHFDAAFAARDPFHRDFLVGHDIRFLAATATIVTPTLMTAFALELPAARGPLDTDERHLAERLGRHAAEALRAYERVRRVAVQALAGHGLLEAFGYPMWLLDAERHVLHANAAARTPTEPVAAFVGTRGERLVLRSDRADRQLGVALHALGQGRRGDGHDVRASIDLGLRRSDPPSWLQLHALAPKRVLGAFGDHPLVLATLFDPRQMRELDPFALTELFGMTPTQGRVAVLLAEGLPAKAIAIRLGSSVNTVRTHLRSVMAKLGAARAGDAVRLLNQSEALWSVPKAAVGRP